MRLGSSDGDAELALLVQHGEFVLAEPTPDAVRLTDGKSVVEARFTHRAIGADGLGAVCADGAGGSTLALGMEEDCRILASAGAVHLPVPMVCVGSGEPGEFCHDALACVCSLVCLQPNNVSKPCQDKRCNEFEEVFHRLGATTPNPCKCKEKMRGPGSQVTLNK